jgi:hypothetical protein
MINQEEIVKTYSRPVSGPHHVRSQSPILESSSFFGPKSSKDRVRIDVESKCETKTKGKIEAADARPRTRYATPDEATTVLLEN